MAAPPPSPLRAAAATQPRRVVIALLRYFPHGGLQRIALDVALELQRRGHHVRLLTQDWQGPRPEAGSDGSGTLEITIQSVSGLTNHGRATSFGRALTEACATHPADVVLGFDRLPGLDLYFAGDPCYSARIRRDRPWLQRLTPRARAFLRLERAVFGPGSRARVLLMDAREEAVIRAEYGTEAERFSVLPPGFSATRKRGPRAEQERATLRRELGIGDAFLALALGSDFHRKGFDRALLGLCAAGLAHPAPAGSPPNAVLAIAGSGDDARLRRLAREHGVANAVRWLGARDDVPGLLQAADLLVHPCRSEPAGMVLLEALSAGTPVLVAGAAGYASHVEASRAGAALPEPFQQQDLDEAWIRIMSEPAEELAERALRYAAGLRPEAMIEAVAEEVERR